MTWTFPKDIRGWLQEGEARALADLAAGKRVLEVGSFHGRSTISMAQMAAHLVSVDHHKGDADSGPGGTLDAFRDNLATWGLSDRVEVRVESFLDASRHLAPGSFDLVFIDAAHDRASVEHDAFQARRLVKTGGIVAFHDWASVTVRAGAKTVFSGEPLGRAENMAWFQVPAAVIEICIPSRSEAIDGDVLTRAHNACLHANRHAIGCNLARVVDRYSVVTCRNRGVAGFLTRREYTHLLFLDDDVLLPGEALATFAGAASRHSGILAGCIPSVRIDESGEVVPYVQVKPLGGQWLTTWPATEIEAEAVGGGCMLIPRRVFELIEFPWFRWPERYKPGLGVRATTDDADFCERARAAGIKVFAIPEVRCGHKKTIDVAVMIED